jgi:hypothetical protein
MAREKGHGEKLNHERRNERLLVRTFGDGAETRTAYVEGYGGACVFCPQKAREKSRDDYAGRGLLDVQRGPR